MSEIILIAISSGFLGVLVTKFFDYLATRKSRGEQSADLSQKYLSLVDLTADQLEERINLIGKLDNKIGELTTQNRSQQLELETIKASRIERDEQLEALGAQLASLQTQIEKDHRETSELHKKYNELKDFTQSLIDALEKKGIALPELNGKIPESIKGWKWQEPK